MDNTLERAAVREINGWVEEYDGDWRKVKRAYLETIGMLAHQKTVGANGYAYVLKRVYEEMEPKPARPASE